MTHGPPPGAPPPPGHAPAVRQLIAAGAKVDPVDAEKRTPLTYASIRGHADAVGALLSARADSGAADRLGKTALGLAQERGHRCGAGGGGPRESGGRLGVRAQPCDSGCIVPAP
jgi:ankyrin repeat protein